MTINQQVNHGTVLGFLCWKYNGGVTKKYFVISLLTALIILLVLSCKDSEKSPLTSKKIRLKNSIEFKISRIEKNFQCLRGDILSEPNKNDYANTKSTKN